MNGRCLNCGDPSGHAPLCGDCQSLLANVTTTADPPIQGDRRLPQPGDSDYLGPPRT